MGAHYPNHILFSIAGLGKITVATITAEIGDSGEKFPTFRAFYNRLMDRGKSEKAEGEALARKIACGVYATLKTRVPWNEEYDISSMRRAEQMS